MIVRELFAQFGVDFDSQPLAAGSVAVQNLWENLGELRDVLTSSAIIGGAAYFVVSMANAGEELSNTSEQVGVSAQNLVEWRYAAATAGVSAQQLTQSISILDRNIHGAIEGDTRMRREFRQLGVSLRDANGHVRDTSDVLMDTGVAIANIHDQSQRTAVAMQIFGRSGARLIPLFSGGADSVEALRTQARELYGTDLEQLISQSQDFNAEMDRWDLATDSVRAAIALDLLPIARELITWIGDGVSRFRELARGTYIVEVALGALAVAATVMTAHAILPFAATIFWGALAAAAVGAVLLVVEDLTTAWNGGHSAIQDYLDATYGLGTTRDLLQSIHDLWEGISIFAHDAWTYISQITSSAPNGRDSLGRPIEGAAAGTEAEVSMSQMRRQAALRGEVVGERGQAYDAALEEANRVRRAAGLADIGAELSAPGTVRERPHRATTTVHQTIDAPITVQAAEHPEETARMVRDAIRSHEAEGLRQAQEALVPTED